MNRFSVIQQQLAKDEIDSVLITSYENVFYYSGFRCAEAYLLITKNHAYVLTDFRYTIQAREECSGCEIVEITYQNLNERLTELFVSNNCKVCGFEEKKLTVQEYQSFSSFPVKLLPYSDSITHARLFKDEIEIEKLQTAQSMADRAFALLLEKVKPGMTENEVAAELDYLCRLQGSEGPSFDTIVGSGPNGAMCHAVPGERKLQNADLVVVDFGCIFQGYHSDMTRTFGIGKVSDKCREIYDIVLNAQLEALHALKSGVSGLALDQIARDAISKAGYGDCFGHGLGHGFGLEIHEPPRASVASNDILLTGMTITDEPGIYLEGEFGVRIEDCLVVTDNGCINLVNTTKDLIII